MSTTALHLLVSTKRLDIVKFLLENDPKAKPVLSHLNKSEPPLLPIHSAIHNRDIQMAQLLLDNGASVVVSMPEFIKHVESTKAWWFRYNMDDKKKKIVHYGLDIVQPLEMAVADQNIEMVQLLLEHGANVNTAPRQFYQNWEWKKYFYSWPY